MNISMEALFALIAGAIGAWGGYTRNILLVGVAVVILALACFFAWAVAG